MILIVDDETSVLDITKTALTDHRYRVLTANNGIEAITLYAQHQQSIRAVLIDVIMPSISGSNIMRAIQTINPTVKLMVTSGLESNQQLAKEVGAKAFLLKPFTIDQLLTTLNEVLHLNCL